MSNIFSSDRQTGAVAVNRGMIALRVREEAAEPFAARGPKRRTTIWEMHQSVHCSIIGTCLSSAELRRLMLKLGVEGAATADDHTLHKQGVALASRAQGGAKFIQKALDRRHEMAILWESSSIQVERNMLVAQAGAAEAATEATLEPGGAKNLRDLSRTLAGMPRRRDFKTRPMIADNPEVWDAGNCSPLFHQ
jgi:hypothetical protein